MNDFIGKSINDLIDREMRSSLLGAATTASTASESPPLTMDKIIEAHRRIMALGPPPPRVKIIETWNAMKNRRPARIYAKRRSKSPRHLARMRKKWLKRYGETADPAVFRAGPSVLSHTITYFVHPALMPQFRQWMRSNELAALF